MQETAKKATPKKSQPIEEDVVVVLDEDDANVSNEAEAENETGNDKQPAEEKSDENVDAWANVADVDMSDIVILDEYDSNKPTEVKTMTYRYCKFQ